MGLFDNKSGEKPTFNKRVRKQSFKAQRETGVLQQQLNAVDQYGPLGSTTYEQAGTWEDGTPRLVQKTALNADQQRLLDSSTRTQGAAAALLPSASSAVREADARRASAAAALAEVLGAGGLNSAGAYP